LQPYVELAARSMVPIIVFAYARPEHLAQTLKGLRANRVPLIYAFGDGPRTPEKAEQVASVREILRAVDWCDLKLIERNENLGLAQSIMTGVSSVLDEHESVIVLEDDCVPLDGFYKFMVQSLNRYHQDGRVGCISGYGLPGVRHPTGLYTNEACAKTFWPGPTRSASRASPCACWPKEIWR